MNPIGKQLAALESRLLSMESKNKELENQVQTLTQKVDALELRPDTRKAPEELSPMGTFKIKQLALDIHRYGWEAGTTIHGLPPSKRGKQAPEKTPGAEKVKPLRKEKTQEIKPSLSINH